MKRCLILLALIFSLPHFTAAEASSTGYSLAKTLTPEEFARAGLNKLTPDELAFLDAALARQQAAAAVIATQPSPASRSKAPKPATPAPVGSPVSAQTASDFGAEQVSKVKASDDNDELHTHIEGTVQEFSGRAVFVLANGQVWQQRTPQDVFLSKKLVNPEVTLLRTSLGYKMIIDAAHVVVFVKRIQ